MSLSSWDGFSVVDPLHRENFQHSAALRDLRMTSAQSPGLIGAYSLGLHWEFPSSDFSGLEESAGTRTPGSQTRVPQILGLVGDSDSSFYTKALSFQSSLTPPPPRNPGLPSVPHLGIPLIRAALKPLMQKRPSLGTSSAFTWVPQRPKQLVLCTLGPCL